MGTKGVAPTLMALSLLTVACAVPGASQHSGADSQASVNPASSIAPELIEALSDGAVTRDEYRAGFVRFEECMAAEGYELARVATERDVIRYAIPSDAVSSGADERCYFREFQALDEAWQVSQENNSVSSEILANCLDANGIAPRRTVSEMYEQITSSGIPLQSCLDLWAKQAEG